VKKKLRDYFFILFGAGLDGFAIACFVTPAQIAPGGVSGLANIMYYATGIDTGLVMLLLSVPLFLLAIKIFGPKYGAKCLAGMLLLSLFVTFFGQLTDYKGFLDYSDTVNILLSSVFGGALTGGGIGLVMKSGANTGGTDILAQTIARYTSIPVGTALFICDGLVVLTGGLFFGLESALFAFCCMFISSQTVNYVVMNMGNHYAKTAYIISDHHQKIVKRIVTELNRSATLYEGMGAFSGSPKMTLMAVVPNRNITALTRIVQEEDSTAFMFVLETYQVLGTGFVPINRVLEHNKNASDT